MHYSSSPSLSSLSASSSDSDSSASASSLDDYDHPANRRVSPDWFHHRPLFELYGYHLDTVKDVRLYYDHYLAFNPTLASPAFWSGYPHPSEPDNNLCKDRGLPDRLFRGSRRSDGKKIVIKATHSQSRELSIIRYLSSPTLSTHPANHTIPVLDIIELQQEPLAFIIQEEWNSSFAHCAPSTPRAFLQAVKQCLEGLAFMHTHNVAHLDISRPNILTNCFGSYAYIDFELSRRFPSSTSLPDLSLPTFCCRRGTELPPEAERGDASCPFKIDIWALGVTLLRASLTTGFEIPGLVSFLQPMLSESPSDRPSAIALLHDFEQIFGLEKDRERLHSKKKTIGPMNIHVQPPLFN